jgi:hypothetical protein
MTQLLQEIRLKQAMKEKGVDLPYTIDHATPKTAVGDKEYPLVFPRFLINTDQPKTINTLFIGLITDKRKQWLTRFPDAVIINSLRGRSEATKVYDKTYFDKMAQSKFVLCPDGDFVWTYRFFEAILSGAIPVIQNHCSLYRGYMYVVGRKYNKNFYNIVYREVGQEWSEANLAKMEKEMML